MIIAYVGLFFLGCMVGLSSHSLARTLNLAGIIRLLDAFGRVIGAPFTLLTRAFRKKSDYDRALEGVGSETDRKVDPREQQISDSAQTVRSILLNLASVIQKADQVADNSSQVLGEARDTIDQMNLTDDLKQVHAQLIQEIDRVLGGNNTLRRELAHSQAILAEQRQQIESLRTAVRIDGLTKLANRAYFDEKMAEMGSLFQRYHEPFSIMMIDVDNFKDVNDSCGHQGGDRILKGVAFKIRSGLRESDFVARYGGDEFAVILIKALGKSAEDVALKICADVRESRFLLDGQHVTATVSIGVAEIKPDESPEQLLKRADEALYKVKEAGRNGVWLAS